MTLRVRLLLGLVVLAAIGLAVAGGVTYHEQQSFFAKRVREQLASALAVPDQFSVSVDQSSGADASRPLPFGTYAELRYPDGTIQADTADTVSTSTKPTLPSSITVGRVF